MQENEDIDEKYGEKVKEREEDKKRNKGMCLCRECWNTQKRREKGVRLSL